MCVHYQTITFRHGTSCQVGFDQLGGTDEFSTEDLEERLAKAQVIFTEGESSIRSTGSSANTRSIRQSTNPDSSDSE